MLANDTIQIDTLHVHGAGDNPPGLRLALADRLNRADLYPPGLPPAAVLMVRHIIDPRPGRLGLLRQSVRVDPAWERAVRQSLADFCQRAARPVRGYIPLEAEAVLFADEAELLACLALDLNRGQGPTRWWWRSVARTRSLTTVEALLCREAQYVPAVLQNLTAWEQAESVLSALTTDQSLNLLSTLCRDYGITNLGDLPGNWPPDSRSSHDHSLASEPTEPEAFREPPHSPFFPPLWASVLGPLPDSHRLEKAQAGLLGVGLLLHRNPALVRGPTFRYQFEQWWTAGTPPTPDGRLAGRSLLPPHTSRPDSISLPEPKDAPDLAGKPDPTLEPPARLQAHNPMPTALHDQARRTALIRQLRAGQIKDITDNPPAPAKRQGFRQHPNQSDGTSDAAKVEPAASITGSAGKNPPTAGHPDRLPTPAPSPISSEQLTGPDDLSSLPLGGVHTHVAGVFYLINLMRHLGLPDCFEDDWRLAGQLGPWGMLELLARAFLSPTGDTFMTDPLWYALANLAGHPPNELPGAAFQGAARLALPPAWVEPEPPFFWAIEQHELRLWTATGVTLVRCRRDSLPAEEQAHRELRPYLASDSAALNLRQQLPAALPPVDLSGKLLTGLNQDLARWLAGVLPFLRYRLQQAFGGTDALIAASLTIPGDLYVTASHVDVVMNINHISLPVRLAGLDRDPGWLVDWGRVVKFHFE